MFGSSVVAVGPNQTRRAAMLVVAAVAGLLALCILAWVIVYEPSYRPWVMNDRYPTAFQDLLARIAQVNDARAGNNIYLPLGLHDFTYPPVAIMVFLPFAFLPTKAAFLLWTLISLLCLAAMYLVVLRATRKGSWLEHSTIAVWAGVITAVLFPPVTSVLNLGQTGAIIVLLVVVDFLAIRDRSQGVLVGIATAFKLYPGVVIVFWLVRRQWRPAITASVTFGLFTAVSWLLWPRDLGWFFSKMLLGGQEMKVFEDFRAGNSSVTGFLLGIKFLSQSDAVALGVLASVAIGIAGVFIAARVDRLGYRVCALVTLLCTSVLVSPVAWDHYFTFVPLLIFVIMEVRLSSAAGRVAAVALAIFTFPWFDFLPFVRHPSLGQDFTAVLGRNALFVAAVLILATGILAARPVREGDDIRTAGVADSLSAPPLDAPPSRRNPPTAITYYRGADGPAGKTVDARQPDPQPSG
jgi:alpha-1,2-mannosyltransferase